MKTSKHRATQEKYSEKVQCVICGKTGSKYYFHSAKHRPTIPQVLMGREKPPIITYYCSQKCRAAEEI